LRPILACMWTKERGTMAPMEFDVLRREMPPEGHLQEIVDELLRKKMSSQELAEGPQIPELNQFLEEKIEEMTLWLSTYTFKSYPDTALLDQLFRRMVREQGVW
ncbi:MAG: nucleotidyltransferase domain-containing protein, partial [Bacteroidota bacterium]